MSQYSSPIRSYHTPIPAFTRTTSFGNVDDSFRSTSKSDASRSATNVIGAFRELQAKAKKLEADRSTAFHARDEIRDQISRNRRGHALWRTSSEAQATDALLSTHAATEQVSTCYEEIKARIRALNDMHESLQRGLTAQKSHKSSVEEDIIQLKVQIRNAESNVGMLSADAADVEDRCDYLDDKVSKSPGSNRKQSSKIRSSLIQLEDEIQKVKDTSMRSRLRADALERYIDLMLSINEDLCKTIIRREKTKEKIIEFAKKYTPPRYTWPRNLHYSDVVNAVTDAALTSADDNAFSRAATATLAAISTSPVRIKTVKQNVPQPALQRPQFAPVSRKISFSEPLQHSSHSFISRSVFSDDDDDDEMHPREFGRKITLPKKRSSNKKTSSKTQQPKKSERTLMEAKVLKEAASRTARMTVRTHEPSVNKIPSFAYLNSLETAKRVGGGPKNKSRDKNRNASVSRSTSPLSTRGKIHDDADYGIASSFIPANVSGGSKEFNSRANFSIANRALKQLSASIVSSR